MVEKKEKAPKSKIEIQTRKPEKRGIFANLTSDRPKNDHPLREILNFPTEVDIPQTDDGIAIILNPGYPSQDSLDSRTTETGYPSQSLTDSQAENIQDIQFKNNGYPGNQNSAIHKDQYLDSQADKHGYPQSDLPNIQNNFTGYPKPEKQDSKISKEGKRIAKPDELLDSRIAEPEISDSQSKKEKKDWQKYDKSRKSKGVFLRTSEEITKKFKQFCIANDWDFSQGTELAWNKLMNDLDSQPVSDLDSLIALDDRRLKMMFKTKVFIINLYLRYNSIFNEIAAGGGKKWSARWSPRDDESAQRYNDLPPAIIELGILQTQIQKGFRTSRIQTFKYYTDEIEKVLASGVSDEMLNTILIYHRQIWKNQTGREVDLSFLENNSDVRDRKSK